MITGILIAAALVGGTGLVIGLLLGVCLLYTSDAADEYSRV